MARRLAVLAAMFLVIVALFWAGVHNLRARRSLVESHHVPLLPGAAGNASTVAPAEGAELEGKMAPAFTLTDTNGRRVSLSDFKGRPVVVNFWATWCGPCKLEMPWIEEFYTKYKPQGLVVLGLSQDDGISRTEVATAAKKIGVSYPILMPDEKTPKDYGGVDYLPETFFVSKTGKVVAVTAGAPTKDQMEANIKEAITGGA